MKGKLLFKFQFLYGAIKRQYAYLLKSAGYLFQFLYGAIKSSSCNNWLLRLIDFNSYMVRLKELPVSDPHTYNQISIPIWCD